MSGDTPRSIDRTPRQVAGPGVDDDPIGDEDAMTETTPRDPHPVTADPDDLERLRADDDVVDVRDPDVAPVDDPSPAHLAGADPHPDEGPEPQPALVGEPVDAADPDAVRAVEPDRPADGDTVATHDSDLGDPDPGSDPVELRPDPVVEPEPVALDEPERGPVALDEPGPDTAVVPEPVVGPEPVALDEPDPDTAVVPEPDLGPEPVVEPAAAPAGFMADTSALRERWESVQVGFVDDPRHAVEEAHEMVAAAVSELQAQIDRQRDELGGPWRSDDSASTDALLTAFHGYRELFDRVLAV